MRPTFAAFSIIPFLLITHAFAQGNGSDHSQNVENNLGIVIQYNLQKAAKASMVDESGWMRLLTPAHDPDPVIVACRSQVLSLDAPPNSLRVFFGNNVASCPDNVCVIVAGTRGREMVPLITVSRVKAGLMADIKVFDKDGNILAGVDQSKPHINKNLLYDWSRPDEHTVWVRDNHDARVLYLRLLNSNALYVEGTFYLPDTLRASTPSHKAAVISKEAMTIGGQGYSGNCMGNFGRGKPVISFEDHP